MTRVRIPAWLPVDWLKPAPDSIAGLAIRRGKSPWSEGIHLLWSMWLFITPVFSGGYTLRWLWLTLLTYPAFLLLYVLTVVASRQRAWRYAIGMIVMAAALLRWYPSGFNYFVFGCVMLRTREGTSLTRYLTVLWAINAAFLSAALWVGYPWQSIIWMPAVTTVIGVIVRVERRGQQKEAELLLSHAEVRRLAATAERERIGRDLHDLLGHTLSLITLKLELSRKLFDRDAEASRRELAEAERVARHALAEVRSAVTGIRATDLAAELAAAKLMLESSDVNFDYESAPPDLDRDSERGLALVLREAVTNVVRHARADRVRIVFERDVDGLLLRIEDDGRGGIGRDGNGLAGMRERVADLGGTLDIDSPRGGGTRLSVRVPPGTPALYRQDDETSASDAVAAGGCSQGRQPESTA
ncbi:MAG: sensor histidine kinase [Xanthomonadales bacterium]|nr:sensor histidine kinase [Xanthomonadales bacterium]